MGQAWESIFKGEVGFSETLVFKGTEQPRQLLLQYIQVFLLLFLKYGEKYLGFHKTCLAI